jgi:cysteine desulfurase/selenocysteine lyase
MKHRSEKKAVQEQELDVEQIRRDFPILMRKIRGKRLAYLDNAATTQKPSKVIEAIAEYYRRYNANIHRGAYLLSEEATAAYEEAHAKVARFIGAEETASIIFTRNCTEAINLVAYSWGRTFLKPGDRIVLTQMEHHSNLVPWLQLAKEKGIEIAYWPIEKDGTLDLGRLDSLLGDKTRLVSVTHVSNVLGTINPVREIAERAHQAGAAILIDAAQSVPHFAVNVQELNCDFLAFSGHKMLGPTGIGVLYAKTKWLEKMPPFLSGGDMISDVTFEEARWNELPWKFEAGTPNIAGGIGLAAAIDYLSAIGMEAVWRHEQQLVEYTLARLKEMEDIRIFGPLSMRGGVISFELKGIHPHDLATFMDMEGVAIRAGHHCAQPLMSILGVPATARVSFYLYNNKEDVDQFIQALNKAKEYFKR